MPENETSSVLLAQFMAGSGTFIYNHDPSHRTPQPRFRLRKTPCCFFKWKLNYTSSYIAKHSKVGARCGFNGWPKVLMIRLNTNILIFTESVSDNASDEKHRMSNTGYTMPIPLPTGSLAMNKWLLMPPKKPRTRSEEMQYATCRTPFPSWPIPSCLKDSAYP